VKSAFFSLSLIALMSTSSAFAKTGFGTAGCGLGSIIFGNEQGAIQILAATFNSTAGNQTFGITSGTSNCAGTAAGTRAELFISVNKEMLAKDISRGRGETLDNLSSILGCSDSAALGTKLQGHFSEIFPTETVDSSDVTQSIFGVISANKDLNCKDLAKEMVVADAR